MFALAGLTLTLLLAELAINVVAILPLESKFYMAPGDESRGACNNHLTALKEAYDEVYTMALTARNILDKHELVMPYALTPWESLNDDQKIEQHKWKKTAETLGDLFGLEVFVGRINDPEDPVWKDTTGSKKMDADSKIDDADSEMGDADSEIGDAGSKTNDPSSEMSDVHPPLGELQVIGRIKEVFNKIIGEAESPEQFRWRMYCSPKFLTHFSRGEYPLDFDSPVPDSFPNGLIIGPKLLPHFHHVVINLREGQSTDPRKVLCGEDRMAKALPGDRSIVWCEPGLKSASVLRDGVQMAEYLDATMSAILLHELIHLWLDPAPDQVGGKDSSETDWASGLIIDQPLVEDGHLNRKFSSVGYRECTNLCSYSVARALKNADSYTRVAQVLFLEDWTFAKKGLIDLDPHAYKDDKGNYLSTERKFFWKLDEKSKKWVKYEHKDWIGLAYWMKNDYDKPPVLDDGG